MLVIKSSYLAHDDNSRKELFSIIKSQCESSMLPNSDVVASIVLSLVINKPLPTQFNKIKSLYKQFDSKATAFNRENTKKNKILEDLYGRVATADNIYRIEQLGQAIEQNNINIDKYTDEKSQTSTICPKCRGENCDICSSGYIKASMRDAQQMFVLLGISFNSKLFLTLYWTPILFIVSDLQIKKAEAVKQMDQRLNQLQKS
ncbi:MAG: hypothetical protein GY787_23325 [Alteromonadales bacterium]|nr:hypothetical protein [Alteromonadales bacterium]